MSKFGTQINSNYFMVKTWMHNSTVNIWSLLIHHKALENASYLVAPQCYEDSPLRLFYIKIY